MAPVHPVDRNHAYAKNAVIVTCETTTGLVASSRRDERTVGAREWSFRRNDGSGYAVDVVTWRSSLPCRLCKSIKLGCKGRFGNHRDGGVAQHVRREDFDVSHHTAVDDPILRLAVQIQPG